jgi:hypothetical protein
MRHACGTNGVLLAQRDARGPVSFSAVGSSWLASRLLLEITVRDHPQDQDVIENPPRRVQAQFELIASRIADAWISSGKLEVSVSDLRLAREFLEHTGYQVQEVPGLLIRLTRDGHSEEVTREKAVLLAMRRLATRD